MRAKTCKQCRSRSNWAKLQRQPGSWTSARDFCIGSSLDRRVLRVVLASNAENAAVLFRLRLVARRFYSELPKYVARLNFSGLSIPTLPDEIFIPFSNLSLVDLSGCRRVVGTTDPHVDHGPNNWRHGRHVVVREQPNSHAIGGNR